MMRLMGKCKHGFGLMKFTPIEESDMVAEPLAFKGGVVARMKNLLLTRSTLNLMQVTFEKVNKRALPAQFNTLYNKVAKKAENKNPFLLDQMLSLTLYRVIPS